MSLLTPELIARFAEIGKQDHVSRSDTIIVAKFIRPVTGGVLYVAEYRPDLNWIVAWYARPLADGFPDEWQVFDLADLEQETVPFSPRYTTRDAGFKEGRFADVVKENPRQRDQATSLLNPELVVRFAEVGSQENVDDPIVVCKFFTPSGAATWYLTEYLPEKRLFFGYVQGLSPVPWDDEWGYSSQDELETIRCPPFGLPIERDLYFEECRFSELKDIRKRR